jgi:hypothetical protein
MRCGRQPADLYVSVSRDHLMHGRHHEGQDADELKARTSIEPKSMLIARVQAYRDADGMVGR